MDFVYENLGDRTFRHLDDHLLTPDRLPSNGFAPGDYDNDGDLDVFLIIGNPDLDNRLYRNDGQWQFEEVATDAANAAGRASQCAAWADYDNDGDLDLVIGNGFDRANYLFRNDGGDAFTRMDQEPVSQDLGVTWACAWGDYDNDGSMDLYVSNTMDPGFGAARNFHNNGNDHHWLKLVLEGTASNRSAIGAKVRVLATIDGEPRWQMREISGGGGGWIQNDMRPNFGLKDASVAETVRIEWPSGTVQELHNVAADQILQITEPPELTIERAVVLSWPVIAEGYVLESAASTDGPWTLVSEEPSVDGNQTTVTVKVTEATRFFQLRQP